MKLELSSYQNTLKKEKYCQLDFINHKENVTMKDNLEKIKKKIKKLHNYFFNEEPEPPSESLEDKELEDKILDLRIDLIEWEDWITGYINRLIKYNEIKWDEEHLLEDVKRIEGLFEKIKIPETNKIAVNWFNSLIKREEKIKELVTLLVEYKNEFEKSKKKNIIKNFKAILLALILLTSINLSIQPTQAFAYPQTPDGTNKTINFDHRTITAYDENGHRKAYILDGYDRITNVLEYNNDPVLNWNFESDVYNTSYEYDAADNIVKITDALGGLL